MWIINLLFNSNKADVVVAWLFICETERWERKRKRQVDGKSAKKYPSFVFKLIETRRFVSRRTNRWLPLGMPRDSLSTILFLRAARLRLRDLGSIIVLYYNVPGCLSTFREDAAYAGPNVHTLQGPIVASSLGINALIMHESSPVVSSITGRPV